MKNQECGSHYCDEAGADPGAGHLPASRAKWSRLLRIPGTGQGAGGKRRFARLAFFINLCFTDQGLKNNLRPRFMCTMVFCTYSPLL